MRILSVAAAFYASAFLIHLLVWRWHVPNRQTAWLLNIFSTVLVIGLVISPCWPASWLFSNAWEVLHVAIFHVAAMLAYVVAYSAIEERSPSMTILSYVADSYHRGRSRRELESVLMDISPVDRRLAAMIRDKMVQEDHATLMLTLKGQSWAKLFSAWRRLLGFRLGG